MESKRYKWKSINLNLKQDATKMCYGKGETSKAKCFGYLWNLSVSLTMASWVTVYCNWNNFSLIAHRSDLKDSSWPFNGHRGDFTQWEKTASTEQRQVLTVQFSCSDLVHQSRGFKWISFASFTLYLSAVGKFRRSSWLFHTGTHSKSESSR
jgi:hypothetical protein